MIKSYEYDIRYGSKIKIYKYYQELKIPKLNDVENGAKEVYTRLKNSDKILLKWKRYIF